MCTPDFILYAVFFFFFSLMKNPGCKEPNQRTVKVTVLFLSERANIRNVPNCPPAKARLERGGKSLVCSSCHTEKVVQFFSKCRHCDSQAAPATLYELAGRVFFFHFYLIFSSSHLKPKSCHSVVLLRDTKNQ